MSTFLVGYSCLRAPSPREEFPMSLFSDNEKAYLQHQHFGRLAPSGKAGLVLASAPTIFMLTEQI